MLIEKMQTESLILYIAMHTITGICVESVANYRPVVTVLQKNGNKSGFVSLSLRKYLQACSDYI